jgi:drug/metabolite transporter (DMT)-like permease
LLHLRIFVLTSLAMLAFAGNSLLCRLALKQTQIDAASFTTIRILSGALTLCLIARLQRMGRAGAGNWPSALALLVYAAAFSFAYRWLSAATGSLLLFGAVQVTMIGQGLRRGERFNAPQLLGFVLALAGLLGLLMPGLEAPPLAGAALMLAAGVAWGVYSLRGKGAGDPTRVTAGNFLRAAPLAILVNLLAYRTTSLDGVGAGYAAASGAITSGIGYALWYSVLPRLKSTTAATVQLCVPVLTAFGGIALLGESITLRLLLASVATLGGIALVLRGGIRKPTQE